MAWISDAVLIVPLSTYRRQQRFADAFFNISRNSQVMFFAKNTCVMMSCFCDMVDRRKGLALFPAGTIVRDPHYRESLTHRE